MPWPIGMFAIETPDHSSSGRISPGDSPGKSMPVGRPKPKRSIQLCTRASPNFCAMRVVPTLLECWTISLTSQVTASLRFASPSVRS